VDIDRFGNSDTRIGRWFAGFAGGSGSDVIAALRGAIVSSANLTPNMSETIEVLVSGQPGANKRTLYMMAASVAFGVVINRKISGIMPPTGAITVSYPLDGLSVLFRVKYSVSLFEYIQGIRRAGAVAVAGVFPSGGLPSVVGPGAAGPLPGPGISLAANFLPVYGAIQEEFVGGTWDFNFAPAFLRDFEERIAGPTLPWTSQVLITPNSVFQNLVTGVFSPSSEPTHSLSFGSRTQIAFTNAAGMPVDLTGAATGGVIGSLPNPPINYEELVLAALTETGSNAGQAPAYGAAVVPPLAVVAAGVPGGPAGGAAVGVGPLTDPYRFQQAPNP
jgi:hypothetical protein